MRELAEGILNEGRNLERGTFEDDGSAGRQAEPG